MTTPSWEPIADDLSIHFTGPFTFGAGPDSLFHSPQAGSAGVYLWTFRQGRDGTHLIHYVGETDSFARRQREHLIHMLGMNYGVFDPDDARAGKSTLLYPAYGGIDQPTVPSAFLNATRAWPQSRYGTSAR